MDVYDKFVKGLVTLADQEEALREPRPAYWFAKYVKGANIEKCQEAVLRDPYIAYCFGAFIPGANIRKCLEACKGTKWEGILSELLMEKALE